MFGPFPLPAIFFFNAWLLMMFWGMVAPDLGVPTLSYARSMLVTIGLWLVVYPVGARGFVRRGNFGGGMRGTWRRRGGTTSGQRWSIHGDPQFEVNASFAGSNRRVTSKSFRGGNASAFFGAVQIDLRDAVIESPPAVIEVKVLLGGVELIVPPDWNVDFDVITTLGATTDERRRAGTASDQPHLVIKGSCTLGGVTVKD